jgi:hypothetical protein
MRVDLCFSKEVHDEAICRASIIGLGNTMDFSNALIDKIGILYAELDRLADTFRARTNEKRALLDLSSALGYLFGTASESQVKQLQSKIKNLQANVKGAADDRQALKADISGLGTLTNDRFLNLWEAINKTGEGMDQISKALGNTVQRVRKIDEAMHQVKGFTRVMSWITMQITEIHQKVSVEELILVEMETWIQSMLTLMNGRLPEKLVTPKKLQEALLATNEWIRKVNGDVHILDDSIHLPIYYSMRNVRTFLINNVLYITIQVPLASYRESFDVYSIETFPVPMRMDDKNGVHGYTILKSRFPYLAVMKDQTRYKELSNHEYQLCSQVYDPVCPALAVTYPSHRRSCLLAVFIGEEKMINSECDFQVQTDRAAPTMVAKLTKNKHLLINVPSPVRIQCGTGSEYIEIGNYTEVTLACGCRFHDNSITGEIEIESCDDTETSLTRETSVKYPIGYAAMKLFEATNNVTFKENLLSEMSKKDTEPELAMPKLRDMSYELARMAGRDRSLGFSMKELVKEADKRKVTYTEDTSPDVLVETTDLVSWVVFGVMIA